ncbi:MAG: nuclear transport factor 2 family protein [Ignavibacteria bacterium]|nr:nuclear transport factor 2 family protein [Ignavibacteria bacterium]
MKLTKKLEAEILEMYNKYWDAYLNGKMNIMSSLMDENCQVIGSGQGEVFKNKKDSVKYYTTTADQVAGKVEMRNRKISISPSGSQILIIEENDFFILMDSVWTFYGQGRISTQFAKSQGKWKVIHQHGSLPDARTSGGEQVNTDKIKQENVSLKDAIKRRTIELEQKNRELEIEASLERVRAVAMSMNKSDDLLSICEISFKEFKKLGFDNLRNSIIHILNDEKGFFLDYDYSDYLGGSINNINYNSHPVVEDYLRQIKRADDAFAEVIVESSELEGWKDFRRKSGQQDDPKLDNIPALFYYLYSIGIGDIGISTFKPIDESQIKILKRFRNVFDLAYRTYTDIAKAEAQAREAQIEAALERVRSRSMGMQKSEELKEVIQLVYEQFVHLKINVDHAGFVVDYTPKGDWHFWIADEQDIPSKITHPYFESVWANQFNESKEKGEDFFATNLNFEEKNKFYNELLSYVPGLQEASKDFYLGCPGLAISTVLLENVGLYIENFSGVSYSDEENKILVRFGKVFQQTYTRFLDLQKAEAQAREAQIEAALERVRSRSMAMYHSEELKEVVAQLFEGVDELGFDATVCNVSLINKENNTTDVWTAHKTKQGMSSYHVFVPSLKHSFYKELLNTFYKNKDFAVHELDSKEKKNYIRELFSKVDYRQAPWAVREANKELVHSDEQIVLSAASLKYGMLVASGSRPLTTEEAGILQRFAKVFEQTYTRFLDLKNAEAQARESQIEAALERVRSKTMAMHNSQDVGDTVVTLFNEVLKLGLDKSIRVGIGILEDTEHMETWSVTSGPNGEVDLKMGLLNMTIHPMLIGLKKAWKSGKTSYSYDYIGDDVFRYYEALNNEPEYPFYIDLDKLPENEYHRSFIYSEGILFSFAPNPISDEAAKVLDRFARVFGQTYRRYRDLLKAEAQTREAKVEASLERVRSQAMAMHSSEDLALTIDHFFHELKSLNIKPIRCGVGIKDGDSRTVDVTVTSATEKGEDIKLTGKLTLGGHPILDKVYESLQLQAEYFPVLRGEEISKYYQAMNPDIEFPNFTEDDVQYGYYFHYKEGGVFAWTEKELLEEEINIFRKFKSVLSLTYRRYIDLKEAEARAREAEQQASLDRVRAEIASMRTSEDLNHITPIIWRELKNLEVPFFRCGVFIVNEENKKVQVYLTTPDGKSLGVLDLAFSSNEITKNTVEYWQKREIYKTHWNKEEFISWTKSMMEIGQVQNEETYQGSSTPPESLDLHFVPFTQGMLYVGDVSPLTDEKLDLVKTLSEAFSIAYARYEDFKNIEEAKNKIEITLSELKSAQAQLVHSEKMASLGELTAGIAHEIKNPLNFVNNFSEVSRELLDEMKTELQNTNNEEVIELIEDLEKNLDKINQHGNRADSIIKGMLQHSRGSSGEKTLTDINDLLDQYVNLAYHGMRAQNKEFNITIEKNYDKTLKKIHVVSQDISRVFLNIINNACYAAFDKKKKNENNFSPTLKVSTKNLSEEVEIRIEDNGNGIPASVKEQIFNPFFTTKPTGEGTGLGLSLSYDIITKVHGGNIIFESEEGKHTEFIITLPKD